MTLSSPGKHLLMTADTVSGVWHYASSLAQELARRDWTITLVTLGPAPRQEQFLPLLAFPQIDLEITELALEWQDPEGQDRERVLEFLTALEDRVRPDMVHLNGYREACAPWRAPVLVAAHSCLGSWWQACRGSAPSEPGWQTYLADVASGLASADRWVAPTAAFRDVMTQGYAPPRAGSVIWNGVERSALTGTATKQPFILGAGRCWDEARNVGLLPGIANQLDWPFRIAGAKQPLPGRPMGACSEPFVLAEFFPKSGPPLFETQHGAADGMADDTPRLDNLAGNDLRGLMRRAGIFVAPTLYEPFGPAVLEAAAAGCALVLADIATFRELWDGAAVFVDPRDANGMATALNALSRDTARRQMLQTAAKRRAARYTLTAQATAYERLYREMLDRRLRRPLPLAASFCEAGA